MNKFEAILLITPEASSSILKDNLKNFEESIAKNLGKIKDTEDWGLRDLSYDINNFKKAFYRYYQLEIDGSNIHKIKKNLNQNDSIIRHLFIRVNEHQELPTNLNYEKN